jgi:subtilisin family serine protease
MKKAFRAVLLLLMVLPAAFTLPAAMEVETAHWVFFTDRGTIDTETAVAAKIASPSEPKNLSRRAALLGGAIFDERDLPVNPAYIEAVAAIAGRVRTVSRYLNGVSVEADGYAVERIRELAFVTDVRPVTVFRRPAEPEATAARKPSVAERAEGYSYGNSYEQISMIGIHELHNAGYRGKGIVIAVLDSGFDGLGHAAFDSLTVVGMRDFVDGDDDVTGDNHGIEVLSILAALDNGNMIGSAPHASYLLARTENVANRVEERVEEDYWVAGIEWADSLGADVVNSSLGYTTFDDGTGYMYSDLDGDTAVTTIAADAAAEKGIIVVTSAGNEGDDDWYHMTTPADGDSVIAVGSVDADRIVSKFSSRGPTFDGRVKPDFVALGENVLAVDIRSRTSYKYVRGTSYAAPLVSGAAALLLEVNPGWDYGALRNALVASASPAGPDSLGGYGIPDVFAASGLEPLEPPVSGFRVYDPYPQPVTFSLTTRRIYFPVDIPVGGRTLTLRIFTFSGEMVQALESPVDVAGTLKNPSDAPSWDGTNYLGEDVAPGVYFFTIQLYGYEKRTGKIMVMR